jgi:hypothetical protein
MMGCFDGKKLIKILNEKKRRKERKNETELKIVVIKFVVKLPEENSRQKGVSTLNGRRCVASKRCYELQKTSLLSSDVPNFSPKIFSYSKTRTLTCNSRLHELGRLQIYFLRTRL